MRRSLVLVWMAALLTAGCASSSSSDGTGGSIGTGGTGTSGGAPGAAGATATGGTHVTGGAPGSGGAPGTGGIVGTGGARATGGNSGTGGARATGGSSGAGGARATGGSSGAGGARATGGAPGTGGSTAGTGGATGGAGAAGNPNGSCSQALPANGHPADTSNPTTVVGTGTADSCTFSALSAAVGKGGVITFNCGAAPVTIAVTATLNLPTSKNTVIDGGNKITLDGGNAVQILKYYSANFQALDTVVTLQHLTLVNGKTTPTEAIPPAPEAACSQGWNDGQGGALSMRDGNLVVIDCVFANNQAAPLGPDTGGGAIYLVGSKHGATIVSSTFTGNKGSVGGAIYSLYGELDIYDTLFTGNVGTGNGANSDDASMCSAINNDQNEVGSGGNGGAIAADGNDFNILFCGDDFENNVAGTKAFGGALCFTSDNIADTLSIIDTRIEGNTGGH